MRAPRVVASKIVPEGPSCAGAPITGGCAQAEAVDRQTAAIERQTTAYLAQAEKFDGLMSAILSGVEAFRPAADEIRDLGQAQKKLCAFVVKHRVKILLSIPLVLTTVGAISPTAADGLRGVLLNVWGVQ